MTLDIESSIQNLPAYRFTDDGGGGNLCSEETLRLLSMIMNDNNI